MHVAYVVDMSGFLTSLDVVHIYNHRSASCASRKVTARVQDVMEAP